MENSRGVITNSDSANNAYPKIFSKIGKFYLLCIGIDEYENLPKEDHLKCAEKDVRSIYDTLITHYHFDIAIEPIINEQATAENIEAAIKAFQPSGKYPLEPEDTLVIYHAGHGVDNLKYTAWVPYFGKRTAETSLITHSTINSWIGEIKALHVLVISDSCFAGGILKNNRSLGVLHSRSSDDEANKKLYYAKSRKLLASSRKTKVDDYGTSGRSWFSLSLEKTLIENSELHYCLFDHFAKIKRVADGNTKQNQKAIYESIQLDEGKCQDGEAFLFRREHNTKKRALEVNLNNLSEKQKPKNSFLFFAILSTMTIASLWLISIGVSNQKAAREGEQQKLKIVDKDSTESHEQEQKKLERENDWRIASELRDLFYESYSLTIPRSKEFAAVARGTLKQQSNMRAFNTAEDKYLEGFLLNLNEGDVFLRQVNDVPDNSKWFERYEFVKIISIDKYSSLLTNNYVYNIQRYNFYPFEPKTWEATPDKISFESEFSSSASLESHTDLFGHTDEIKEAKYHPLNTWLLTNSKDGTTRIWDLTKDKELHKLTCLTTVCMKYAFDPKGLYLARIVRNENAKDAQYFQEIWDIGKEKRLSRTEVDFVGEHYYWHPEIELVFIDKVKKRPLEGDLLVSNIDGDIVFQMSNVLDYSYNFLNGEVSTISLSTKVNENRDYSYKKYFTISELDSQYVRLQEELPSGLNWKISDGGKSISRLNWDGKIEIRDFERSQSFSMFDKRPKEKWRSENASLSSEYTQDMKFATGIYAYDIFDEQKLLVTLDHTVVGHGIRLLVWDYISGEELRKIDYSQHDYFTLLFSKNKRYLFDTSNNANGRNFTLYDLHKKQEINHDKIAVHSNTLADIILENTSEGISIYESENQLNTWNIFDDKGTCNKRLELIDKETGAIITFEKNYKITSAKSEKYSSDLIGRILDNSNVNDKADCGMR